MSGKTYLRNKNYFKSSYYEAIKYIAPQYLTDDDIDNFGKEIDIKDQVINSHLELANNFSSVIHVSGVEDTLYSSISSIQGISPYFVKQNSLTNITTNRFQEKILTPLNKSILDYKTSSSFADYVSGTLLPSITLNRPTAVFTTGDAPSAVHNYLIENLSWMYFLNTTGTYFDPSTYVTEQLVNNTYQGKPILLNDSIKGLMEHVWKNNLGYYPSVTFASSTETYLSGTQQLDNLKTWVDVLYSPLFSDESDFTIRDRFETFIDSGITTNNKIPNGPFTKFLRALSFLAFDIDNQNELISTIYDIDECPDEYLPFLAQLIGWDLFGGDPDRWRLQLRNAVSIYKAMGTKRSLQFTVNTVFPKDAFPIQSKVTEVYESYIPFLIYYALATESEHFKSFSTGYGTPGWDESLASQMGVSGYSISSLDENIRLATDRILFEVYTKFKGTAGFQPFPESVGGHGFNYRGRNYPIPPFEEYPYYANFEVTKEVVDFIADRLACFGVRQQFAYDVSGYLNDNVIDVDDEPRAGSFLFFTSGYNEPPNISRLVQDSFNGGYSEKFEYASLWSGKSSHFKVVFDASAFDFDSKGVSFGQENTGDAFTLASRMVKGMSPSHAIPLVRLDLEATETLHINDSLLPLISPNKVEIESGPSRNYWVSGLNLGSYKRNLNPGGTVIKRSATETLVSPEIIAAAPATNIPRNSMRRRSYEKIMPFNGYYDRTGFNMPTSLQMSGLSVEVSGIPLGFIPSGNYFVPIPDHVNLPDIWSRCETSASPNTYYGYSVSNALLARVKTKTGTNNDRGQLDDIYATMHSIKEATKFIEASAAYGPVDLYTNSVSNVYQAYANLATDASGWFPTSQNDFYNFSFGKDLHKLYNIYTSTFNRHQMNERLQYTDGANLFSHTFGPILYNHDLEDLLDESSYLVSSLQNPALNYLSPISTLFSGPLSYVASDATDMYLDTFERVVSGAVSAVELIHTSGSQETNSFAIFKIDSSFKKIYSDPYMYDNTFILSRSTIGGLPRVRFDISKYAAPSDRPISTNFLMPEHDQELKVRTLVTQGGTNFGHGRSIGIWIHTKPESGSMWSFTAEGKWVQHDQLIGRGDVVDSYAHINLLPTRHKPPLLALSALTEFECLDNLPHGNVYNPNDTPMARLHKTDFDELTISFNTRNRKQLLSKEYQKTYKHLHRKDQEYVVEVFMVPNGDITTFMLLDTIKLQDMTLKKMSEIFVNGKYQDPQCIMPEVVGNCAEYRHPLTGDQLRHIFRFFNNIAGKNSANGLASRYATESSAIMSVSGGSKLDYRVSSTWFPVTKSSTQVIDEVTIDV